MPLPKRQLLVLALCRISEPIAFTSIFPYIFPLIRDLHITDDEKMIGKYGGLVSSVFSLGSFLTGLAWGRASDIFGRKPIVLLGLIGTILSSLIFGFSHNIYQLIGSRFAAGLLNGNVGVIRTMVAELVTEKRHQATAFSIMPIVWQIGSIFGPALGGALADPVKTYPTLFGRSKLFKTYPYALPNLVTAALLTISVSVGWLLIEETLSSRKDEADAGRQIAAWVHRKCCGPGRRARGHYRLPSGATDELEEALMSNVRPSTSGSDAITAFAMAPPARKSAVPLKQLFTPQVTLNIITYSLLSAHTTSFDQIFPMFLATSTKDGGLGLEPQTIGICLSIIGGVAMILQIAAFPPLQRRYGSANCLRWSLLLYSLVYTLISYLHKLAGSSTLRVCAGVLAVLFGKVACGVFAFPASAILVTNATPHATLLGSVNGLNQAIGSFMRMLGPAVFGFILSYSLESGITFLVWVSLALVSGFAFIASCFLQEDARRPEIKDLDEGVNRDDVTQYLLDEEMRRERRHSYTLHRVDSEH